VALVLLTPPAVEPVSLAEAKSHLRVDGAGDDGLIANAIAAARQAAEDFCGLAFITQTWRLYLDALPATPLGWWDGAADGAVAATQAAIAMPRPPLASVISLTTYDDADTPAVMDAAAYFADTASRPGRLVLRSGHGWPAARLRPANGVAIEFTAGYGNDASAVPRPLRQGMLAHVAWLYQHRGDDQAGAIPDQALALYRPFRAIQFR
jgi:Phage gp6-like head-tail connector protein